MAVARRSGRLGLRSVALAGTLVFSVPGALGAAGCKPSVMPPQTSLGAAAEGPIPIDADETVFGSPKAPATLVTFIDFAHPDTGAMLDSIEKARGKSPDDLRYVLKLFPQCRYRGSRETAVAAKAVLELGGPIVFWRFQKLLLEYQSRLSAPVLRSLAEEAGLPEEHLGALSEQRFAARVQRDQELGRALGVVDSPTSFLNGVRLNRAVTSYGITQTLEAELPKARALADQNHPVSEVYRLRTLENAVLVGKATQSPSSDTVRSVPVDDSPSAGPATAPLTLVEFADFSSGCSKEAQPELARLREKLDGQLRVVFKHLAPGGVGDRPATSERWAANFAEYAREVGGDAKFFEAERLLWQSAPDLSLATLERLARELGLDPAGALRAIDSDRYAARIDADVALAQSLGLSVPSNRKVEYRDPSFFLNGHLLPDLSTEIPQAWLEAPPAPAVAVEAGAAPPPSPTEGTQAQGDPPPASATEASPAPVSQRPASQDQASPAPVSGAPSAGAPAAVVAPALAPDATLPFRGRRDAPVVVDMFASYLSASCELPASLERLMVEYPNSIKLVFRPLIERTEKAFADIRWRATEAALEAHAQRSNAGFWAMSKLLCRDENLESTDAPEEKARQEMTAFAKRVNLDPDRFRLALQDKRHRSRIEAAMKLADELGVDPRRPTFFVNGQPLGAEDLHSRVKRLVVESTPAPAAPAPEEKPPAISPPESGTVSRAQASDPRVLAEARP